MKIALKKSTIQPGVTPIENMILDVFLPIVDEISLKVYLFLYKRVFGSYEDEITLEFVSKELKISTIQTINALKYWKNNGVLDFTLDINGEIEEIEFYNFYARYSGNVYNEKETPTAKEKPLIDNKEYFKKIESIISFSLKPYEINAILDHMQETGHKIDLVYRAYKYAHETGKSKSTSYIIGILRGWKRDKNIMTVEDLDSYIMNKDTNKKIKRGQKIKRYIESRDIMTEKERLEKLKDPNEFAIDELYERVKK